MGDFRWVRGEIEISPHLTWNEIQATQTIKKIESEVKLDIEEAETETPDGTLIRKTCSRIIAYMTDRHKAYNLREAVQAIVDQHPEHKFTGYFECWLEQPEVAPYRVWVDGRIVHEEAATIAWPNEK